MSAPDLDKGDQLAVDLMALVADYVVKSGYDSGLDKLTEYIRRILNAMQKSDLSKTEMQSITELKKSLGKIVDSANIASTEDGEKQSGNYDPAAILASVPFKLEEYQIQTLNGYASYAPFKDKVVLEVAADLNLAVSRALLALGAKHVYAVNPGFYSGTRSPDDRITLIKKPLEETGLSPESIDILMGIAILEHSDTPEDFAKTCLEMTRSGGKIMLNGGPVWTCPVGHHTYLAAPSGANYFFHIKENNPWKSWEHLTLGDCETTIKKLMERGVPQDDAKALYEHVVYGGHISRKKPSEIVSSFKKIFGDAIKVDYWPDGTALNEYYQHALEKYTPEDLKCYGMQIFYTKP